MVPLGDPKRGVKPFQVECPIKGEERWITDTDWAYEFSSVLPGGIECTFTTLEAKSVSGNVLQAGQVFRFHTGGPTISRVQPYEGSWIREDQYFILRFDSETSKDQIEDKLFFFIENQENKIPVRVIQGKEREELLKVFTQENERKTTWVISAKQTFPSGKKVRLLVEKGIKTLSGIPASSDWTTTFVVRDSFTAGFSCERVNAKADCMPISSVYVTFSAPIDSSWKNQIRLKTEDGKLIQPSSASEESEDYYGYGNQSVVFRPPFPPKSKFQVILPKGIQDESGRPLANFASFPLQFKTDDFPPLAKFSSVFGILERTQDTLLPVTIRNIEALVPAKSLKSPPGLGNESGVQEQWDSLKQKGKEFLESITGGKKEENRNSNKSGELQAKSFVLKPDQVQDIYYWLKNLDRMDDDKSVFNGYKDQKSVKSFSLPSPSSGKKFEVLGIPLKEPGFHIVEIESRILGNSLYGSDQPMFVKTGALVTNLSVHFKWGKEGSLVWITSLDKGSLVEGAEISIYDCKANVVWQGKSDQSGQAMIRNFPSAVTRCSWRNYESGLLVLAKKGDDFSFTHTQWDNGIQPWRFNVHTGYREGADFRYTTVLDRALFREGETVSMNHVLRVPNSSGFRYPKNEEIPVQVLLIHAQTGQEIKLPVKWSSTYSAETKYKIPKESILGEYSIFFVLPNGNRVYSTSFTCAQFRVPLLKAELQADSSTLIAPKQVSVSGKVQYLSGGTAGLLPVTLRSVVKGGYGTNFAQFPDIIFARGKAERSLQSNYYYGEESEEENQKPSYQQLTSKTDANGFVSEKIQIPSISDSVQSLEMEMEFKDPNGEIQTIGRSFQIYPEKILTAIQSESWVAVKSKIKSKVYVSDLSGNPVKDKKVSVHAISVKYISHRKRLVGGFYSYEHRLDKKDLGEICSGKSDGKGTFLCEGSVDKTGEIYLESNADGGNSYSHTSVWVVGEKEIWFGSTDHDRMDLIPEKRKYEPGETARFQVRMPFKNATALVTVEREGVLKSFTKVLDSKSPMIEIPIEANYGPNIFVSVLAVRGRVESPAATALVDLAKPSFRLGLAEIQVGWKPFELGLKVQSEKSEYRPRQKAKVKVQVVGLNSSRGKETRVTLAAVDEGLLELKPNLSWDLLKTMMSPRGIQVNTSTAQMYVIGRRHFGLKSVAPGGGGGRSNTRELFDTLLFWKADLIPNEAGELEVEIPLNDSLTSFRVVAVAYSGRDRFGSAHTTIRTNQEILAYPSVSPTAREGDLSRAGLALKNTSNKGLDLQLRLKTNPSIQLEPKSIRLNAYESKTIHWDLNIPSGIKEMSYEFSTEAQEISFQDTLRYKQKVESPVPEQVLQANFYQLSPSVKLSVEQPSEAEPNRGKVDILLNSTLVGGPLESISTYMNQYPYDCLEQQLSRTIATYDERTWKAIMANLNKYIDSDGLLKFFPDSFFGSVPLTAYALLLSAESNWEIPQRSRDVMISALNRFADGTLYRSSPLATTDTLLRKITALETISYFTKVESSRIRSVETDPNRLPIESLISLRNLYRNSNWDSTSREKVDDVLRARLRIQGTSLQLVEGETYLWWLLSSRDTVHVRLLASILKDGTWKEDMPKLLRGALNGMRKGHWDITPANAIGALALRKYAGIYETSKVSGKSTVQLANSQKSFDWEKKETKLEFVYPPGRSELEIAHSGSGEPYATVRTISALPLKAPIHSGIRVSKEILDESGKPKSTFKEGDIVKVRLKIRSEFSISWLALKDPIPSGATALGSGLGRDSSLLTETLQYRWDSPSFMERKFDGITAYYELFYPGEATLEYLYRINSPGAFKLPPTRVEALYQPDIYSMVPNEVMRIDSKE
ncbi:peptidase inhibitor [Leptospira perolatii]|uniref:Peptidase inhibitor n=2 Tax=Leptospira perolatii TaxID=2023191 RepID=A0A2M9ZJU4_9LEPT|nr:peptidase inhibitor [Leptospira perolatii]PJZ72319.1 peptidase inhibitor [Leptospira perolatii]